jgi:hypothetical protein
MTAVAEFAPPAGRVSADVASRFSSASREPACAEKTSLPGADQVVAVLTQMVLPLAA